MKNVTIGGADGPTALFILKGGGKMDFKQRLRKIRHTIRKKRVEKKITAGTHSMSEVCTYLKKKYGFREYSCHTQTYKTNYEETRLNLMMEHAPELLGEYGKMPKPSGTSEEDIKKLMDELGKREEASRAVPVSDFDIRFRMLEKRVRISGMRGRFPKNPAAYAEERGCIQFLVEEKYGSIQGSASGSKRVIRWFHEIDRDIHRYYGVTEEDISKKTERYENLVQTLIR